MLTRKIDVLGRITLPKEIRNNLGMEIGQDLVIESDNEKITLYKPKRESKFDELKKDVEKVLNSKGSYQSLELTKILEQIPNTEELAKAIAIELISKG